MRTASKFALSMFALVMMVGFSGTAMAAEKVTIEGTVTGQDGMPAANVPVRLMKAMAKKSETKSAPAGAALQADKADKKGKGAGKMAPLAETTTNDKGEFTMSAELEPGDYAVTAGNREAGNGRAMISVKAGEKPSKVSIALKAGKKK